MTIQSEYYDPDTDIIHINQIGTFASISTGSTEGAELGLEDTGFDDVKVKVLSIEYNIQGFSTVNPQDWQQKAFAYDEQAAGQVIFGIANKNETIADFTGLAQFTGTSAFPVAVRPWMGVNGTKFSVSKTWKPRKMGLSNEQNAFITCRVDSATSASLVYVWHSIYMRLVRL